MGQRVRTEKGGHLVRRVPWAILVQGTEYHWDSWHWMELSALWRVYLIQSIDGCRAIIVLVSGGYAVYWSQNRGVAVDGAGGVLPTHPSPNSG